ncbi:MAG: bifunctional (p)ppGpp synthetase/guanosine-3',5'-bis(diphosphate) 3'-pyrophosphohydrolase [Anaerolineae bacterium]|nr:bifunctional (p)ppGpp synthetase/guanosine-3',5'-bis(diphosphate) 3'-pyrophosphohydrolase [Anaerolineae bacterium]
MTDQLYPAEMEAIFRNLPKLNIGDQKLILDAYELAADAHHDQFRKSGEPYMIHPVAVAEILSELKMDASTIAAALLHDVVEDTPITLIDLERRFGLTVARLVDGVTKMDRIPTETTDNGARPKGASNKPGSKDAETFRKLFLAMGNDIRVVLIKLADRIHNMRTLGHLAPDRQKRMARETLDIFAPLANRLGIWQMKWELEDLSFRYLNPEKYKEIAEALAERRTDRQKYLERVKQKIETALAAANIKASVSARPKHIYSIYKKMERKQVDFSQIYDVRAVRVIVEDKPTCYHALGIVHSLWRPIPSEFDDYIAAPKENSYQSLHTAVIDDEGRNLEVQIRTVEMHEHAEYGVAAHWRYKEGAKADVDFEMRLNYLRKLMDTVEHTEDNAEEYVNAMKQDVFANRVYIFSPKGDIFDLPAGSTVIDYAYHVHTEIGHRCRGARVNGEIVPLTYVLKPNDRVEILTAKQGGPSLDWLNPNLGYVHTTRAQDKIRAYFRKQDRVKNVAAGADVVERELKKLGLGVTPRETVASIFGFANVEELNWRAGVGDITGAQIATKVLEFEREKNIKQGEEVLIRELVKLSRSLSKETVAMLFGYGNKVEDFLAQVGEGNITPLQIDQKVLELEGKQQGKLTQAKANASDGIEMLGSRGGMLINLARCCNPVVGDAIIGYITRGNGVTVHRIDCKNVINTKEPERFINVSWGRVAEKTYPVPVIINAYDREGLMRDIGGVVANENINIGNVNISTKNGVATFLLTLDIADVTQLARVLDKIEQLPNVMEARRRT